MTAAPLRTLLPILLALATACSRDGEPREPADEPEAADHPTGISAEEGNVAKGTSPADAAAAAAAQPPPDVGTPPASFACDKGASVDVSTDAATVRLSDGRAVTIAVDPKDAAHFQGEALEFRMAGKEGDLSQDESPSQHCKAS